MEKRVAHHIGRNLVASTQDDSVVVAEVADVGDAANQWFDQDGKGARLRGVGNFT